MNWLVTEHNGMINLDHVKAVREADNGGGYAYFEIPADGKRWTSVSRVYLTKADVEEFEERYGEPVTG